MKTEHGDIRNRIFNCVVFLTGLSICIYTVFSAHWIQSLDGDNAPLTYAVYSAVANCLHNGELPLWNSYIWGGFSNIGSMVTQAFYPINWILCLLFYDSGAEVLSYAIIPANIAVHITIYFLGLYFLLRKLKVKSFDASIICMLSVMTFSFTHFFTWIVYFNGFSWFPLIILATLCLFENKKGGMIGLIFLFAVEAMLSVSQMLIMIVAFLAVLLLLNIQKDWWKLVVKMGIAGIIAILLSSPIIMAELVFLGQTKRFVPDLGWIDSTQSVSIDTFYSLRCSLDDLKSVFNVIPTYRWLSLGGILLILLLIGLFAKPENKVFFKWSVFGLFFTLLYAMGVVFPEIVYYIPLLNVLREPFMYACFFNLFGALVAANGMAAIRRCVSDNKKLCCELRNEKILYVILCIIFVYNLVPHNILSWKNLLYLLILVTLVVLLCICLFKKYNSIVVYTMLCGAIFSNVCYFYNRFDKIGKFNEKEAIAQVQKVNDNNRRELEKLDNYKDFVGITSWGEQCLPLNQQSLLGIRDVQGYFNPVTKAAVFLQNGIDLEKRSQLQDINYFLINDNNSDEFLDWFDKMYDMFEKTEDRLNVYKEYGSQETEEVSVYRVNKDVGAGWCIGAACLQGDMSEEEISSWINNPENDLSKIALVSSNNLSDTALKKIEGLKQEFVDADVELLTRKNNKMVFHVNANTESLFVCTALYSPDWKVYVNGEKKDLLQIDYSNIGTLLSKGESVVEFVYNPNSFLIGSGLQIFALICIIYIIFGLKKEKHVKEEA